MWCPSSATSEKKNSYLKNIIKTKKMEKTMNKDQNLDC